MSDIPDLSQRNAIYAPHDQSVLVTAPPGYGKTFVMPKRIEYLIKCDKLAPPQRALGLTFTNAAASEMVARLERRINPRYLEYVDAMTFHSFCYRALQGYGERLSLDGHFRILTENDRHDVFRRLVEEEGHRYDAGLWDRYNTWGREVVLRMSPGYTTVESPLFTAVSHKFQQWQLANAAVDFNHLLWFAFQLFELHPDVLEIYRRAYAYVLVDEFQDTNPLQFAILERLVKGHKHEEQAHVHSCPVFIFADDWQSIYGFLGATPKEQIEKAVQSFNCHRTELTEDHRTASPALTLFSRLLRRSEERVGDEPCPKIPFTVSPDAQTMGAAVNAQVEAWVRDGIALHDIAILSRTADQMTEIQSALTVPYLSVPELQAGRLERDPTFTLLCNLASGSKSTDGSLRQALQRSPSDAASAQGSSFIKRILIQMAANYDLRFPRLSLNVRARMMSNEALLEINWGQQLRSMGRDKVFTGSLHSAKGLEFKAVAVVHLERDGFPQWFFTCQHCRREGGPLQNSAIRNLVQDEWRVFYVGVTRASERLALYSCAINARGYVCQRGLTIPQNRGLRSPQPTCSVGPQLSTRV